MLHRGRSRHPRHAVTARGVADAPVNLSKLCLKGIFKRTVHQRQPRARAADARASYEPFRETTWGAALDNTPPRFSAFRAPTDAMPSPWFPPARSRPRSSTPSATHARRVWQLRRQHPRCACRRRCPATSARSAATARPAATTTSSTPSACSPIGPTCRNSTRSFSGACARRWKTQVPVIVVDPRVTMFAQMADMHLPVDPAPIWCCSTVWRT